MRYLGPSSFAPGKLWVGRADDSANFAQIISTRSIGDDQFHQIAFVKSGSTLSLYIDGALDGTNADTTSANTTNTTPLFIGQRGGDTNRFKGSLDEIALFNRALSAQEVASLYNRQSPAYFGQFISRVMSGSKPTDIWTTLSWLPQQPQWKELPNNDLSETGYPVGSVNMSGTVTLLHLNDPFTATTFVDSSNKNTSTSCSGASCPTLGVAGRFNTAAYFNGSTFINAGNAQYMNIVGPIALEAWVMPLATDGLRNIIAHGFSNAPTNGEVFLRINNGNYEVGSWDGSTHFATAAIPSGDVNHWVHLVGVYDGAAWKLYRNGALVATQTDAVGAVSVNANWAIGARFDGTRAFLGTIDESAIYNRPMSAQEALDHYRRGALRVKFQVRSCENSTCAGASAFVGPDGTSNTYFTEQQNATLTPPSLSLNNVVAPNLYFQYQLFMETDHVAYLPAIRSVKASPPHSGIVVSPASVDCTGQAAIVCTIGALLPSNSAIVTITAQVDPAARGTIFNTASVSGNEFDRDPSNNTSTRSTDISTLADIAIAKTTPITAAVPGRTLTYTVVIKNNGGPSAASNARFVDTLPNGVTVQSANDCTFGSGQVNCGFGTLNAGASVTRTIVVTINPDTAFGNLFNTVSATSDEPDPDSSNNTASVTVQARPEIDLVARKFASSDPVYAGTTLTYTLVVSNVGPSTATGVRLTDTLPVSVVLGSVTGAACSANGGVVACDLNSIGPKAQKSVVLTLPLSATLPNGTLLTNKLTTLGNEFEEAPANNTYTLTTQVQRAVDLAVSKSGLGALIAGTNFTYTLAITNNGPSQATNVNLVDVLPAGVSFVSADPSCPTTANCALGTLDPAQSIARTIVVFVAPDTRGTLTNTASVSANEAELNNTNNSASAVGIVGAVNDFNITKTASDTSVTAGTNLTYTIVFTNNGPSQATNVTLTDTLPVSTSALATSGGCTGTTRVVCSIGTLAVGASRSVTIVVQVGGDARNSILNTATVASSEYTTGKTTTLAVSVTTDAELSLSKTASAGTIIAGNNITYTLVVVNSGPSAATNVTLVDTLPAGVGQSPSSTATQGSCNDLNPTTCNLGTIMPNQRVTVTLSAQVDPTLRNNITNTATVSASESDNNLSNNTDSVTTQISAAADLTIGKWTTTNTATAGKTLTYTLTITNNGPSQANNIVVTDTLPTGTTFASSDCGCTPDASGTLTLTIATLAPRQAATYQIVVTVAPIIRSNIVNTARIVAADETDPNTANNFATTTTSVNGIADLTISKRANVSSAAAGTALTYTIIVTNVLGPSQAQNVVVTDALPSGVTFSALNASGAACSGTINISCTIPTLNVGESVSIPLGITVNDNFSGSSLSNTAFLSGSDVDPLLSKRSDTATVTITFSSDVTVSKFASPTAIAGQTVNYTITVNNTGSSQATSVRLTDTLPSGVSFITASVPSVTSIVNGQVQVVIDLGTLRGKNDNQGRQTKTIYIVGTVSADALDNVPLTNNAIVSWSGCAGSPCAQDSASTTVQRVVGLGISKTSTPDVVYAGGFTEYRILFSNTGPSQASFLHMRDPLPTGITVLSATPSQGLSCSSIPSANASGVFTCTLTALEPGGIGSLTIGTQVDTGTANGSVITNTATITASEDVSGKSASTSTLVSAVSNLQISKIASRSVIMAGDVLTYTILVTNARSVAATNATVTDFLPQVGTYGSVSAPGWNCNGMTPLQGTQLVCAKASVPPTTTEVITYNVVVSASLTSGTSILNSASITTSESLSGASDSTSATVKRQVNLALDMSTVGTVITAGLHVTYTMHLTNTGPSDASNVTISDTLPNDLAFISASNTDSCPSQGNALAGGGVVRCQVNSLAAGTTLTVVLDTLVLQSAKSNSTLTNTATLTSTESPTVTAATRVTVTNTVARLAVLNILKTSQPTRAFAQNDLITYTIMITNNGPSTANSLRITDTLPLTTAITYGTPVLSPAGSCPVPKAFVCTFVSLAPSTAVSVMITGTVGTLGSTTAITNTAAVGAIESLPVTSTVVNGTP